VSLSTSRPTHSTTQKTRCRRTPHQATRTHQAHAHAELTPLTPLTLANEALCIRDVNAVNAHRAQHAPRVAAAARKRRAAAVGARQHGLAACVLQLPNWIDARRAAESAVARVSACERARRATHVLLAARVAATRFCVSDVGERIHAQHAYTRTCRRRMMKQVTAMHTVMMTHMITPAMMIALLVGDNPLLYVTLSSRTHAHTHTRARTRPCCCCRAR
jgi:hypothetical protein